MDDATYREASRRVAEAFGAALGPYLTGRVGALTGDDALVADVVGAAQDAMRAALAGWVGLGAGAQRRSPLELLREALDAATVVLSAAGVPPVERDPQQASLLPGDIYDLVPPTSRDLGDEALHAHVAWGLARAEAMAGVVPAPPRPDTGPAVALVGSNLMDRARIEEAVRDAGMELLLWRNPAAVSAGLEQRPPVLALVDLEHRAAGEAIPALAAAGVTVVAYGPHVDDVALAAARAQGAAEALPRSRFFTRLPRLLPRKV